MWFMKKPWFIRLTQREYWPMWIYYAPVWLQHFWLAAKVRNLYFFLATNPAVDGFILSDSKHRTLQLVPEKYRPATFLLNPGLPFEAVLLKMKEKGITFPLIVKPDIGFRGLKVHKVEVIADLKRVLRSQKIPFLIQEYCVHPMEVGIFYFRFPGTAYGNIPSITLKEFLKVKGTGKHTLRELVYSNPRAILQADRIREGFAENWNTVIPKGNILELEPIGNHQRGTRFIDGSHLANKALHTIFDELSHEMEGFYFGRFDIRAQSWKALSEKREFMILEVNGVGGEPTHIYDPDHSLFKAWKDLCWTWKVAAKIADKNMKKGLNKPTYSKARNLWHSYLAYKKELFS